MKNKQTKFYHSKTSELFYWGGVVLFGLLAVIYYSFENPINVIFLVIIVIYVVNRLFRLYKSRLKNPYALILNEKYFHAPSDLVSQYTYPIPWQGIKAICSTIDKKQRITKYTLLVLHDRGNTLGELTNYQIKRARRLSKKYFVSHLFNGVADFQSEEAREKNYQYFLNSILIDIEDLSAEYEELYREIESYSKGKISISKI